jgi:hypothetical protein
MPVVRSPGILYVAQQILIALKEDINCLKMSYFDFYMCIF